MKILRTGKQVFVLAGICLLMTLPAEAATGPAPDQTVSKEELSQAKQGGLSESQIDDLKRQLQVPGEIAVTQVLLGDEWYWEGAGIWLRDVQLYSGTQLLAGAAVDRDTLQAARMILTYDGDNVDLSQVIYADGISAREQRDEADLSFLLKRPFSEAEQALEDLQLQQGSETEHTGFLRFDNGSAAVEVRGTRASGFITRIFVHGRDNPYNLLGFVPGDPVEAPLDEGYEPGGTGEFFASNDVVLVMFYSQADENPYLDTEPYIELQWLPACY